jgi:hypothetical protein
VYIGNIHRPVFETPTRMVDLIVRNLWYAVSAASALALVILLVCRHVLESHIGSRSRRTLDISLFPLFLVFVASIVARPFL